MRPDEKQTQYRLTSPQQPLKNVIRDHSSTKKFDMNTRKYISPYAQKPLN